MKKRERFRSQAQTKRPSHASEIQPPIHTASGPNWASMTDDTEQCATLIDGAEAVRHADRGEVLNKQTLQEREGAHLEG